MDTHRILFDRQATGPGYDSFNETQTRALGINYAFIVFITIIMGLRTYTRAFVTRAVGADDIIMIVGWVTTIGLSISTIVAVEYGVGRWQTEIPLENWEPMLLAIWNTRLFYCASMGFIKLALLALYLRLDNRPAMRWTVWTMIVYSVGISIAGLVISIIGCTPPDVFWKAVSEPEKFITNCMDQDKLQTFWDTAGAMVITQDVLIWAIPIPMVWKLHLPRRQKWALTGVFAIGILAVGAGCVRFYYVRRLADEPEQYYYLADSLNWCAVEAYVAIFCGSCSSIRAFLKEYCPSILGSYGRGTSPKNTWNSGSRSHPLGNLNGNKGSSKATISGGGGKFSSRGGTHTETIDELSKNDSEEAIIPSNGIVMKTEVRQDRQNGHLIDDQSLYQEDIRRAS